MSVASKRICAVMAVVVVAVALGACASDEPDNSMVGQSTIEELSPTPVPSPSASPEPSPMPTTAPIPPATVAGLPLLASDGQSPELKARVTALVDLGVPNPADFIYGSADWSQLVDTTVWWVEDSENGGGPKGAEYALKLLVPSTMTALTAEEAIAIDGGSLYCQQLQDPASPDPQVSCGFYRSTLQGMVTVFRAVDYNAAIDTITTAVADLYVANS